MRSANLGLRVGKFGIQGPGMARYFTSPLTWLGVLMARPPFRLQARTAASLPYSAHRG
jgi:hypothetical protein